MFRLANIAGLVLIGITLMGYFGMGLWTIAGLILIIVCLLSVLQILYRPNLGKYDGHYFHFRNQRYQAAFAHLNPGLVKPHRCYD